MTSRAGKGGCHPPATADRAGENHKAGSKSLGYENYKYSGGGAGDRGAEEIKGSWEDKVTAVTGTQGPPGPEGAGEGADPAGSDGEMLAPSRLTHAAFSRERRMQLCS